MFASSSIPQSPTLGQRAARTARLIKAFATLDDRPLDTAGRPVLHEPELRRAPLHDRRPGTVPAREDACAAAVPSVADLFCAGH